MTSLLTEPTEKTTELSPEESENAIRLAVDAGVLLHLKPGERRAYPGLFATLVALEGATLSIDVNLNEDSGRSLFAAEVLKAAFTLNGRRYAFRTRCLKIDAVVQRGTVALAAPSTVTLLQRRQSRRYKLRSPGRVSIWLSEGDTTPTVGSILNLSGEGIACRLPAAEDHKVGVGQPVRLRLDLQGQSQENELTGMVTNVTPAGTTGYVVLGIQFLPDANLPASQELIAAALEEFEAITETMP
jgi:c-di-GMP-binding flagellar brake protein YcgR